MNPGAGVTASHEAWTPRGWRTCAPACVPDYADAAEVTAVAAQVGALPPLVTSWEILALKRRLAEAQQGCGFLLSGSESLEHFSGSRADTLANRLKVMLQMSLLLAHGLRQPVIRLGSFAGQYACIQKGGPDGVACRGDIVSVDMASVPDPHRMLDAHVHAALSMNFIRALIDGGFTDIGQLKSWNLAWVEKSASSPDSRAPIEALQDALQFMKAWADCEPNDMGRAELYFSHNALLLPYEESCTRQVPRHPGWFNLSTHLPCLDPHVAHNHGAHVEYLRGLGNPVAVHVGPRMKPAELLGLIDILNPGNACGHLVLIHHMGVSAIDEALPPLLRAVHQAKRQVLWVCDPMSGNTVPAGNGCITRHFQAIREELARATAWHDAEGTHLGGIHLELTGEDVRECAENTPDDGASGSFLPADSSLLPRLNYRQSLEIAMHAVRLQRDKPGVAACC
ncbi:3-deoxy-7-phosphoheptulonate synthase [Rhodanobacter sp. PCA2]|uniref:3-deoxy-7-phosphoheptulonate synthase n=1 Tax=Rhodanobacter sp. PCA2 TaxID=2006117 RepID=UPI0015E70117|nr:3-deoxy-7-phosphoheptulonate synthase [Rhodanobacter sp. PCA2]MBA2078404.1 3-deoxy-7-phosphoheptulonate synthase class II [Rhodanobacter sp. PCA2]